MNNWLTGCGINSFHFRFFYLDFCIGTFQLLNNKHNFTDSDYAETFPKGVASISGCNDIRVGSSSPVERKPSVSNWPVDHGINLYHFHSFFLICDLCENFFLRTKLFFHLKFSEILTE